jgi:hypothetical protein
MSDRVGPETVRVKNRVFQTLFHLLVGHFQLCTHRLVWEEADEFPLFITR